MNDIQKTIKFFAIFLAGVIIASILGGILWIISIFTDINLGNNNNNDNPINQEYINITHIDLELSKSSVTIKQGEKFKVETIDTNDVIVKDANRKLVIKEKKKWFFNNDRGEIIIYVPNSIKLEKIEIESGVGVTIIDSISSYDLDIDLGAGRLEVINSEFDNIDIDGGAGTIDINTSILNNLDLDSGVGKINISSYVTGNSKVDCGIGEFNITLLGNKDDYTIITDRGIGTIKIDGVEQGNNVKYGTGDNKLELNGGIGSINVNFE